MTNCAPSQATVATESPCNNFAASSHRPQNAWKQPSTSRQLWHIGDTGHKLIEASFGSSALYRLVAIVNEFSGVAGDKRDMQCLGHITLMGCLAFIGAVMSGSSPDSVERANRLFIDRSVAKHVASELSISDEQRGQIFASVIGVSDASTAEGPPPEIADRVQGEIPMQDLPVRIIQDVPMVQGHKFVKFEDRILIVDPSSQLVVAMIPRYRLLP